jgi:hypothetical protein
LVDPDKSCGNVEKKDNAMENALAFAVFLVDEAILKPWKRPL